MTTRTHAISPPVTTAVLLLVAWGALAFGAVYPWAYRPLLVGSFVTGIWALLVSRAGLARKIPWALTVALVLIAAAVLAQLVPLPPATIASISPGTHSLLQLKDISYGAGQAARHPLSVGPASTWLGLAFLLAFGILLVGLVAVLPRLDLRTICAALLGLATLVALVGIIQKPLYAGRIYGIWEPRFAGSPFGPFVNKNHFAGWMVMALSLALGYYCGRIATVRGRAKESVRERLLWLSSAQANQLLLIGICLAVMALSLVLTLSRSGISCLALAAVLTGVMAVARSGARSRSVMIGAYLALLLLVAIGWTGSEAVARRFASADWSEFNDRLGAWKDAWQIAMRFMPYGSGLNTYGITTLFYQTIDPTQHYVEAHNDYLQLISEGGLLVGTPVLLAILAFAALVWKRFRRGSDDVLTSWIRTGALTGIVAMALQEVVEFSLQMPGNAVLFVVLAAIAIHEPAAVRKRRAPTAEQSQ